jgi:hypothetical protein
MEFSHQVLDETGERYRQHIFKQRQCAKVENHQWVQQIHNLLRRYGLGHIWSDPVNFTPTHASTSFERRINDIYVQNWHDTQSTSSRFKLQNSLVQDYRPSQYLDTIPNIEARNIIISRLRLDMNILQESKGRKTGDERTCPTCPDTIETVGHFILDCPHYSVQRTDFFNCMKNTSPNLKNKRKSQTLKLILTAADPKAAKIISNFICKIY